GVGREPLSLDEPAQIDRIDSPAITHRFDLLAADPARPYLPERDPNGDYIPLDPSVATVDRQSRVVRAPRTAHGRVYALAVLSVGDQSATYPLVVEPKRSYVPRIVRVASPGTFPPVRVLSFQPSSLTPPAAPASSPPPPINTNIPLPPTPQI